MTQKIKIICDTRERVSQIYQELKALTNDSFEVEVVVEQLSLGDYQLSDQVLIERKTIADLESSIIDGRIFSQLDNLSSKVNKPGLIIEGVINFSESNTRINNKSLIGLITAIGLNYRVPIFFTRNQKETALFLYVIAKREQFGVKTEIKHRFSKSRMSFSDQQLFILESFPDIGPTLAKALLKKFKNIRNIANATVKELQEVEQMGPKKAEKMHYLFLRDFI
ncbi:MAG TPA: ERCC4 domain-containing protein [archaeon]|jgi:Fanconi anemia group M protein|nr:ERCC4 domain-containing protein [archaeon]HPV66211.1 ERCC4 domain-containing protein [archaeon]